jgi:hypothetical protein
LALALDGFLVACFRVPDDEGSRSMGDLDWPESNPAAKGAPRSNDSSVGVDLNCLHGHMEANHE